jgi:hypothetical protein
MKVRAQLRGAACAGALGLFVVGLAVLIFSGSIPGTGRAADIDIRLDPGHVRDRAGTAGWHAVEFRPSGLPAGLYLVRLRAGRELLCRKVLLLQ